MSLRPHKFFRHLEQDRLVALPNVDEGAVEELELDQINGIAKVRLKSDPEDAKPHEVKIFVKDRNSDLYDRLVENNITWEVSVQ